MPSFILWLVLVSAWLVWWMVRRKTLDASIGLAVTSAALFTVPFFIPEIGWPLDIEIGVVTTVIMLVFSVVYFHSRDEDEAKPPEPVLLAKETKVVDSSSKRINVWLRTSRIDYGGWVGRTQYLEVENMTDETIESCYAKARAARTSLPTFVLLWEPLSIQAGVYPDFSGKPREESVSLDPHVPRRTVMFSVKANKEIGEATVSMAGFPLRTCKPEELPQLKGAHSIGLQVAIVGKGYVGETQEFRMNYNCPWVGWRKL